MPVATIPNIGLTTAWSLVADSSAQGTIQVVGPGPAIVAIGAAVPTAGSTDGHPVSASFAWSNLTTEKVYARAVDRATTIAVTKA